MINPTLENIVIDIGFIVVIVWIITSFPALRIIANHFDKKFPDYVNAKWPIENQWWILNKTLRGMRYAGCILFKNASKKRPFCRLMFNGYDFRKNARTIDWIIIWVCIFGFQIIILLLGAILWIGNGFHWPPP